MKQTLFAIWLHLALGAGGLASLILKESLHQQNRIYGGTFATKNQYPFVVVSFTMPGPIVSGGAIISEKYIVTTAQHIYNSDEYVCEIILSSRFLLVLLLFRCDP